jgi:hypothetical protein
MIESWFDFYVFFWLLFGKEIFQGLHYDGIS